MFSILFHISHTKNVSNEHGESFHLSPLPSRFHNSKQCSSSPFSYLKLFGSPAFQLVNPIGRPLANQKNEPSSAWSVPDVQKCSCPKPIVYDSIILMLMKNTKIYLCNTHLLQSTRNGACLMWLGRIGLGMIFFYVRCSLGVSGNMDCCVKWKAKWLGIIKWGRRDIDNIGRE